MSIVARFVLLVLLTLPALATLYQPLLIVSAANNQDVTLHLHRLPSNVTVSGYETREILNATTMFNGTYTTPNLRYTAYNFSLYPALALDLHSEGSGLIDAWVTVQGAPGTLNATVYELNAAGTAFVVSSFITVADSTDPNTPYQVSIPFSLNYTFSSSSTIMVSLTASRVGQLYIYYDSAQYDSSIRLPALNVPRVSLIETLSWDLRSQRSFSLNWTSAQRVIFITVHVEDPFGAYHSSTATITIVGPGSLQVFVGAATPLSANPGAPEKLFVTSWLYSGSEAAGDYTISVVARDVSDNQAAGSTAANLYFTIPPGPPPLPDNPPIPTTQSNLWGLLGLILALLLVGGLLGFLFFRKRNRSKCQKCGAVMARDVSRCPKCGAETRPGKLTGSSEETGL